MIYELPNGTNVASWNGSVWETQPVVSGSPQGYYLALDSCDYPHISYIESGQVMYVSWTGDSWSIKAVNGMAIGTGNIYLALDSYGNPHISCSYSLTSNEYVVGYATAIEQQLLQKLQAVRLSLI